MRPTEILSQEHRVIEVMLKVLDKITVQAKTEGKLAKEPAEQAIDFIRTFADGCHHGKEEGQLFPKENGPIAVMLADHEQGREFVRGMAKQIDAAAHGDQAALEQFAANARGYIELLTAHIHKEDHILFPLADRAFSEANQKDLLAQFDRVEEHDMGEGTHETYLDLVRSLAKRYDVPHDAINQASCSCSHHQAR